MDHADHVALIEKAIDPAAPVWADLGSGRGAFTLALADCLGNTGTIYSVDTNQRDLYAQEQKLSAEYPDVTVHYLKRDFTATLDLPDLDGIIMANSLHFIRDKLPIVQKLMGYLKPTGHFVLVEYNTDRGNTYVPYPMSFANWTVMAQEAGFASTTLLGTRPSSWLESFYSALSTLE